METLLSIRQGTVHLKRRIGELDGQMGDVGRSLGEKVKTASVYAPDARADITRNERYWSRRKSRGIWTTQSRRCRRVSGCLTWCIAWGR